MFNYSCGTFCMFMCMQKKLAYSTPNITQFISQNGYLSLQFRESFYNHLWLIHLLKQYRISLLYIHLFVANFKNFKARNSITTSRWCAYYIKMSYPCFSKLYNACWLSSRLIHAHLKLVWRFSLNKSKIHIGGCLRSLNLNSRFVDHYHIWFGVKWG